MGCDGMGWIRAAGDWLQGPYVYYLYSQYGFDKGDIGRLFIAGFGSSMLFGTIVGSLADKQYARPPASPAIPFPYSNPNPMWLGFSLTNRLWCASSRGRKRACITYCISYILSCITKHSPEYRVLMIGRILGGIATSLLFSAFESWLVAEHNKVTHCHCLASCPPDLPITVCLSPSLNYRCCLHH